MRTRTAVICALTVCLAGCAWMQPHLTPPAFPEDDPPPAVLAISVRTYPPVSLWSEPDDIVAFVRLEDDADMFAGSNWVESNYADGERIYLLDAEPGEYVAVASIRVPDSPDSYGRFVTYYDEEIVRATRVTVGVGGFAFLGELRAKQHLDLENGDDAQQHYSDLLATAGRIDVRYRGTRKEFGRDRDAERKFLEETLDRFGGTGWAGMFEARLGELRGGGGTP